MRILRHLIVLGLLVTAAVILRRSIPPQPALTQVEVGDQVQGKTTQQDVYLDLQADGTTIRVRWFRVEDAHQAVLLPNYENFLPSTDVIVESRCKQLTSAGFYGENDEPLGLVVSKGVEISPFRSNALFNGVLSINDFGTPRITRNVPSGVLTNAVQTGPIMWENGSPRDLNLNSDKKARRVSALITGSNELYFVALYNAESAFEGPYLSHVPELLNQLNSELNLNISDAINLDGGTASVFVDGDVALSELSPVGSFWCIK